MRLYCYKNIPEVLHSSSSGGAFIRIAKSFFQMYPQAVAYGVVIDKTKIYYKRANTYDECFAFQGSKYVSADMKSVFEDVKDSINQSMQVLFVGTPCKVFALKKYLEKNNIDVRKLLSVDLICHGTGRKQFWDDYLLWLENKYHSKIVDYSFRYKKISWSGYPVYIEFENGKKIIDTYESRIFIRAFLKQFIVDKCCLNCKFKTIDRQGDLTLGDFWGIEKIEESVKKDGGVSLIISNTNAGDKIIENINNNLEVQEVLLQINQQGALDKQTNLFRNTAIDGYEDFWESYKNKGFEYTIRHFGIYTYFGIARYKMIQLCKIIGVYKYLIKLR